MAASGLRSTVGGAADIVADVHRRISELTGAAIPVLLWDGTLLGEDTAPFCLELRHPWSLRAVLLRPSDLSLGESYVRGDLEIHGDVIAAIAAAGRLRSAPVPVSEQVAVLRLLLQLPRPPRRPPNRQAHLRGRRHTPARDRAAIAFHYDLSQAFYASFLGRSMVYSCAYFTDDDDDLDRAQVRKLDLVCRKLRLRPGMRLLDIGCGWGSLLLHAAQHYGVEGYGVTLSSTQAEGAVESVARAGLGHRVRIHLQDYRDVDDRFDAVASIGMVEHVGPELLASYAAHAYRLTCEGGLCLTHSICTGSSDRRRPDRSRDFAGRYVFPDGGFGPVWELVRAVQQGGFEILDVEQLRPHYALTLRRWVANLEANRGDAMAAAGEADYRIWRLYMAASSHAFATGHLNVVQVLGGRGAEAPLGRHWMLPERD